MDGCCRCAERRNRVLGAVLGERDDVHVAFDDDDPVGFVNRVAGEKQPVKLPALREQCRLGRIQIFRLPLIDDSAAESDDAAAAVMDRKHHAIAETVVALAAVSVDDETSLRECVVGVIRKGRLE